jgi:NAD(P)-dependent dehydrogenase (short-subunit alcohol dehydrogenase family)
MLNQNARSGNCEHFFYKPIIASLAACIFFMFSAACVASSISGFSVAPTPAGFVIGTTFTLGSTVNAVAPGIIDTTMITSTFEAQDMARMVPMKRAGRPEEVADLIGFLASKEAAYITGQIISINGGMI